jgi:hypothetical protein
MTLLVLAIAVVVVLFLVTSATRWRRLGRGARSFGQRFEEGLLPPETDAQRPISVNPGVLLQTASALSDYDVVAPDGVAGRVVGAADGGLVADIGRLVRNRKVIIPPVALIEIDHPRKRVLVNRTKEELAAIGPSE